MGLFYYGLLKARSKASCTVCVNHTPAADNKPLKKTIMKGLVTPIEPIGVNLPYPKYINTPETAKPIQVPKHIKQVNSLWIL